MKNKNSRCMLLLIALFPLFFLKSGFAFDSHGAGAFNRANVYYEEGNFDEALKQYSGILESGAESGNLYYNLGNCYFKKGELGRAILNYEKARRLMPLDSDLDSNYEYARSLIKGAGAPLRKSMFHRTLNSLFGKLTVDNLTILVSALYIVVLASILASFFFRAFKKYALITALFAGLFFIAGFVSLTRKISAVNKEAIIITERADAKFEPMDKATTYFTLYEGMKVEIISSMGHWRKVTRQDNKSGWVEDAALSIF